MSGRILFELVQNPGIEHARGDQARDPMRWLGAPDWDQSHDGQFRREIADLYRDLFGTGRAGGAPDAVPAELGLESRLEPGPNPSPELRARCDVSHGTPYLLIRGVALLVKRLTRSSRGVVHPHLMRDLVLLEVVRSGGLTPGQLGRRMGSPRSTIAGILRACSDEGLVERCQVEDRRTWQVRATAEGRRAAGEVSDRWHSMDEHLLELLSAAERDNLRRLSRTMVQALASPAS